MSPSRVARQHEEEDTGDQRNPFARDRDRILYCSAFRRLEGVTQVASASEGHIFHNRLTHSIKVAQVARRLAEYLLADRGADAEHLNAEVAEAAGLAHDLGHPPFGHAGEKTLDKLVTRHAVNGFEGNPQSFRIVTRLALRSEEHGGLNLTRGTLAAIMKYPWCREGPATTRHKKWAAYEDDTDAFKFAREGQPEGVKTLEAQVMDWADDIAYSVHDLEDFVRARLVSWLEIAHRPAVREAVVAQAVKQWWDAPGNAKARIEEASERILGGPVELAPTLKDRFTGMSQHRLELRWFTSSLIGRFVKATNCSDGSLDVPDGRQDEVRFLKAITWTFVISNPALAAQQHGQARILEELFEDLLLGAQKEPGGKPDLLPHRARHLVEGGAEPARVVVDTIGSLTEEEVLALHRRLRGLDGGTVLDPIVR